MALSLVHVLERTLQAHRGRPALAMVGGPSLSYADLDRQSAGLAKALCREGIRRGDRVGLVVPKSVEGVVALWGALRAGAVYVAIDPYAPPERGAFVAANAKIRGLLASTSLQGTVAAIVKKVPDVRVFYVHGADPLEKGRLVRGEEPALRHARHVNASDLAYVFYTSGSTGTPKGVMLSHGAALAFVDWAVGRFGIQPDDIVCSHAPLHFDISTLDVFGAAAAGAKLVILDEETMRLPNAAVEAIKRERITRWYSVTGAVRRMVSAGGLAAGEVRSLRTVLFGGEPYPVDELKALQAAVPSARLFNVYGPTETNICTCWQVPPAGTWAYDAIPIGTDCETVEGVIVDEGLNPVPDGIVGELLVRGSTLMNGYLEDPERTGKALVADFLYPHVGDRMYRTGDLVRRERDGTYAFLGRRDHQVKVRGYRVELGEVESALFRIEGIDDAAVVAIERDCSGEKELVAFVVGRGSANRAALRQQLASFLPKYMLPSKFLRLARLPMTSTGKIDRQALTVLAIHPGPEMTTELSPFPASK